MMNVYLALAFIITSGQVVAVSDKGFRELGTGDVLGLPIPFIIMVITYLVPAPDHDPDHLRTQHPRGRQQRDRRRRWAAFASTACASSPSRCLASASAWQRSC